MGGRIHMAKRHTNPQPLELSTGERIATTGRAVIQGIGHETRAQHESQHATQQWVSRAEVDRILIEWPDANAEVARQMLAKYGLPNEATHTKLFWERNDPWKRTIVSNDT